MAPELESIAGDFRSLKQPKTVGSPASLEADLKRVVIEARCCHGCAM